MASSRRVDLKAILDDPERRRRLMVSTIRATQAREGIETTHEQAERAYTIVTERERVACFKLAPGCGNPDRRHELFLAALGDSEGVRFDVARRDFQAIDGRPLAYEQLARIAPLFRQHPALEPAHGRARRGAYSGDDERYVRHWWEVDRSAGSPFTWERFAKGGDYARFYADVDLVVHWDPARRTFAEFFGRKGRETARPEALDDFFRPGLTWPRRTQRGFNVRVLPEGCIFADKGPALFPKVEEDMGFLLGIVNSTLAEYMLRALTSFGSWEVGAVKRLPIPDPPPELRSAIGEAAMAIHDRKRRWDEGNETSTAFATPWLLDPEWVGDRAGLPARLESVLAAEADGETGIRRLYAELNDFVFELYRVGGAARRAIEESRAEAPPEVLWPQMERRSPEQKRMEHVWRLLSHAVRRAVDADQDGIVALTDVSGEPSLAERVRDELAGLVPGADANRLETEIANELSRSVPGYRRVRGGIAEWLEDCFFAHHVALYRSRPVLWHVTSAQGTAAAAFGAVVDYHRFDRDRMAKLRATYVRDAIETCRREAALADRANDPDQRLAWQERREEVEQLDDRLAAIQEGRVEGAHGGPGDLRILTPWKAPEAGPRGWDPALDDGVKVNIAPFDRAGVLRVAGAGR